MQITNIYLMYNAGYIYYNIIKQKLTAFNPLIITRNADSVIARSMIDLSANLYGMVFKLMETSAWNDCFDI